MPKKEPAMQFRNDLDAALPEPPLVRELSRGQEPNCDHVIIFKHENLSFGNLRWRSIMHLAPREQNSDLDLSDRLKSFHLPDNQFRGNFNFKDRPSGALEVQRARMSQCPRRESLKGDGVPDWIPQLLQNDQEYAGPDRRAMNLTGGPVVVAHHQ